MYIPKEIQNLMSLVDTYKRHKFEKHKHDRKYDMYHPSEWGHCLRLQQYKHYAWKGYIKIDTKPMDTRMLRLFDQGHNMHDRWAKYLQEMKVLRGKWKCTNPLCYLFDDKGNAKKISDNLLDKLFSEGKTRIYGASDLKGVFEPDKCKCGCSEFEYMEVQVRSDELNIKGNADVIWDCSKINNKSFPLSNSVFNLDLLPKNDEIIVGDMKSVKLSGLSSQLDKSGPHKYYLIQLTIYVHILNCAYGVLMYECKDNNELRWFKVPRNDKWWEIIKWQAKQMIEMSKEKLLPPPRHEKKSFYCRNCDFKQLCHKSKVWDRKDLQEQQLRFYKELL